MNIKTLKHCVSELKGQFPAIKSPNCMRMVRQASFEPTTQAFQPATLRPGSKKQQVFGLADNSASTPVLSKN